MTHRNPPSRRLKRLLRISIVSMAPLALILGACQEEYDQGIRLQPASISEQQASAGTTIQLKPGDNIQAAVDKAPAGTKFMLQPGTYRLQVVRPKDRQQFIGQPGTVVNGAMIVTGWRLDGDTKLWVADGLPDPLRRTGRCGKGVTKCSFREDLFVGGKRQERVESKEELSPGKWYFEDGTAFLAADPGNALVELSVKPAAFYGDADGVVLRNFTIEKYASAAQEGAIDARRGANWQIVDMTVQWNRGVGLYMGNRMKVLRGAVIHNGQLGIGGKNDFGVVDGVEIAYNNYAGFSASWEAGGSKFVYTDGLTVRNNCVHDNNGPGLWADIDNINIVYEGNKVFRNANDGIKHEISYKSVIRNNLVAENGFGHDIWLWGSQILIQNSSNVEVYGNTVYVAPEYGHGISIVQQDRGTGRYGPRVSYNNNVHDNTVVFIGRKGATGIVTDYDTEAFWKESNNIFKANKYFGVAPNRPFFMLDERTRLWDYVIGHGQEQGGSAVANRKQMPKLSCN